MRMLRSVEDGGENLMGKSSLAAVQNVWNEWEIHCLILASLGLQVFLFFAAGMRRRCTSRALNIVLWLAYLSADSLAIFVLGHLAVRGASGPEHELILFWAPFLLVHLGGQDTITALSMQDNELWTRHLLGFVSQVGVAGYVVSKSSWPDRRLLAATVIVFLAGCIKYAGRTYCLYSASPAYVKVKAQRELSEWLEVMSDFTKRADSDLRKSANTWLNAKSDLMLGMWNVRQLDMDALEIMSSDAPANEFDNLFLVDDLPKLFQKFQSAQCLHGLYEYVGITLLKCYERFYTKRPLLYFFEKLRWNFDRYRCIFIICQCSEIAMLIATMFQYLSTPIALVLFNMSEKGHQVHSRADVLVTYILLVGAIILDVVSASMVVLSFSYIQPSWSRKLWSEKLAQYSMVKRYTMVDAGCMSSVRQWISKRLIAWGVELLDPSLTHIELTKDLKGSVLNSLLQFGISKEYNFANFRGQLALQKWTAGLGTAGLGTTSLYYSINDVKDFPTSVLIWHIATDICYYSGNSSTNINDSNISKKMQMSRELSNYMLYLVFKCGVMLTSNSLLVHNNVHDEMKIILGEQEPQMVNLGENEVVKLFEGAKKDEQPSSTVNDNEEQMADTDHIRKFLTRTLEAIYSPVLPRACDVAKELMGIEKEDERWELMVAVWTEMLFYSAPRCGGAFHYHHLATGGEFITHVLLLMRSLGPFLPGPDSSAP